MKDAHRGWQNFAYMYINGMRGKWLKCEGYPGLYGVVHFLVIWKLSPLILADYIEFKFIYVEKF